jgi:hypothetical protein
MIISNPLQDSPIAFNVYTNSSISVIIEPSVGSILPYGSEQIISIKFKTIDNANFDELEDSMFYVKAVPIPTRS